MNIIKAALIITLLSLPLFVSASTEFNEALVDKILKSYRAAMQKQDVNKVASHFIKSAKIEITRYGKRGVEKLNLSQYKKMLKEQWSAGGKYKYKVIKRNKTKIIAENKYAHVLIILKEVINNDKGSFSTKMSEAIFVINSGGVPKIKDVKYKMDSTYTR